MTDVVAAIVLNNQAYRLKPSHYLNSLKSLHWLPINYRIYFKAHVHNSLNGMRIIHTNCAVRCFSVGQCLNGITPGFIYQIKTARSKCLYFLVAYESTILLLLFMRSTYSIATVWRATLALIYSWFYSTQPLKLSKVDGNRRLQRQSIVKCRHGKKYVIWWLILLYWVKLSHRSKLLRWGPTWSCASLVNNESPYVTNWATLLTKFGPSCRTEVES